LMSGKRQTSYALRRGKKERREEGLFSIHLLNKERDGGRERKKRKVSFEKGKEYL